MKQQLLVNKDGKLRITHFENGIAKVPSAANITIFNNEGAEKQSQTPADINVTTGEMTFDVLAALITTIDMNWKASWDFVIAGDTKYEDQLFDIVNQILTNPVTTKDVIDRAPFIEKQNYRNIFTADSGSANTIVSTELTQPDDWWTNGKAEIINGTNKGQVRKVQSFSSNTLNVIPDYTAAIDATSVVNVIRSYEKEINEAFRIFSNDIKNRGLKVDLIIGNEQVNEFVLNKTIELICGNFTKDPADIWSFREEKYAGKYDGLFDNLTLDYDKSADGNIQDDEASSSLGQTSGER